MKYYYNGKEVPAPRLTPLERRLAVRLAEEDFGDSDNMNLISVRADEWCGEGGFTRVELIDWPNRHQLGALLRSLQAKRLVVLMEGELDWKPSTEVWFECDVMRALTKEEPNG